MSSVDSKRRNHSNRFAVAIATTERARWGREELAAQLMVMVGEARRAVGCVGGKKELVPQKVRFLTKRSVRLKNGELTLDLDVDSERPSFICT